MRNLKQKNCRTYLVAKDYGQSDHPYRLESQSSGYDASSYSWNSGIEPHLPDSKRDMLGATNGDDLAGLSSRYIEADWEERAEIEGIYREVPRSHPHFKYIETLYDYSMQSKDSFFNYKILNTMNYWFSSTSYHGPHAYAFPDHAITSEKASEIVSGIVDVISFLYYDHPASKLASDSVFEEINKKVLSSDEQDSILSRGEAVRIIHHLRESSGLYKMIYSGQ